MKFGLDIFEFEATNYTELEFVEKEIEQLTEIWEIKEEWDNKYEVYKDIQFKKLDIIEMSNEAEDIQDKVKALDREVREWGIFNYLKNYLDKFINTMPLL